MHAVFKRKSIKFAGSNPLNNNLEMVVRPFKGIRPPIAFVKEVASRPYDVLNSEEAREEAK